MKTGRTFLDRLIDRMDRLDPASLQTYILKLVREKGFLETVFNTIREGVIVIDSSLKIRFINVAATNLLGIHDDAGSQRIDRYLCDVDWDLLLRADALQWQRISRQEIEVFYPAHRHLSFYLVPVEPEDAQDRGSRDDIPLSAIIIHDVTQAHEDTEKTIESRRVQAVTMLAAGVAHELGNPLNSLNIHLQLLTRLTNRLGDLDEELAEEVQELLEVAGQEVARLDNILSNFLRAIRPVPLDVKPVNVQQVLSDSLDFMRMEIEDRNILVQMAMPEDVPLLNGDGDQLKQAFYNIIKNAVQAMPEGGVLRIVCALRDDFVDIRFEDTGKGISRDDLSRITEPYYTTKASGTGLGLLIVERVVKSHGGEMGIESCEDKGAAFTISLPRRERQTRLLTSPETPSDLEPSGTLPDPDLEQE